MSRGVLVISLRRKRQRLAHRFVRYYYYYFLNIYIGQSNCHTVMPSKNISWGSNYCQEWSGKWQSRELKKRLPVFFCTSSPLNAQGWDTIELQGLCCRCRPLEKHTDRIKPSSYKDTLIYTANLQRCNLDRTSSFEKSDSIIETTDCFIHYYVFLEVLIALPSWVLWQSLTS